MCIKLRKAIFTVIAALLSGVVVSSWFYCFGEPHLLLSRTLAASCRPLVMFVAISSSLFVVLNAISLLLLRFGKRRRQWSDGVSFGGGDALRNGIVGLFMGALLMFVPYWLNYALSTADVRSEEVDVLAVYGSLGVRGRDDGEGAFAEVVMDFKGDRYFFRRDFAFVERYFPMEVGEAVRRAMEEAERSGERAFWSEDFPLCVKVQVADGALGFPFLVGGGVGK